MKRPLLFWRLFLAACALAWWAARALGWSVPQAAAGMALANLLPGLAALRLLGLHQRSRVWTLAAAGALSPPLLAFVLVLGARLGWAPATAGAQALVVCAAILLWPQRPTRTGSEPPFVPEGAQPAPEDRRALALGLLLAALTAFGLLNPRIRQWSDGWFHAAVFHEVARAGIPPGFPHFAGQALPYPWFFHVYLVGVSRVAGVDPFVLIAALSVWAALLLPVSVYVLARAMGAAPAAAKWSGLAGVLGVNPLGPLWLLAKSALGQTTGSGILGAALANAHAVQDGLALRFPFFQSSLLARLWTPTAFVFALVLAALGVAVLLEVWKRPRPRNAILLALVLCLLLQWHTLTALALGIALGVAVALAALALARADRGGAVIRAGVFAAVAVAVYLGARWYLAGMSVEAEGVQLTRWRFSPLNAWGLWLSMGPVALAGLLGWLRLSGERRVLLGGLLAGLVVPYLFFDLPGPAEEKLYFPLFVMLAAASGPALAAAVESGGRLRAVVALCAVAGLVGVGMTSSAFRADRRPLRELFTRDAIAGVQLFTADEEAALHWVRAHSPRDAVFLESPRPLSNEPLLVYGERRLFLGPAEFFYRATFFAGAGSPPAPAGVWQELKRREALQAAVFSLRELTPDTLAALRAYPWPLYVWWDSSLGGGALSPSLRAGDSVTGQVFASPTVRIRELGSPER